MILKLKVKGLETLTDFQIMIPKGFHLVIPKPMVKGLVIQMGFHSDFQMVIRLEIRLDFLT
jgi:hypothetical protein